MSVSKRPSPAAPPLPERTFPETWITGLGLCCQTGDQPFALLGAVGTHLSGARPHPDLLVHAADGTERPAMTAPAPGLEELEQAEERVLHLVVQALTSALGALPGQMPAERLLVLLFLPGADTARGSFFRPEELAKELNSLDPRLAEAVFRFSHPGRGGTAQLENVCRELAEGKWEVVLFGGADSLVDAVTVMELLGQGRLMSRGGEGAVPGEGAGFLLLQSPAQGRKHLARLKGAAQTPEPHTGAAGSRPMRGMIQAIEEACEQVSIVPSALEGIILPLGVDRKGELEWYQVCRKLWPPAPATAGKEATLPPGEPELLRPFLALGETGAATFPLTLVLACARFEFEYPPLTRLLVCEAAEAPLRGAVILAGPPAKTVE